MARTAINVNIQLLKHILNTEDNKGQHKNHNTLFETTANLYNQQKDPQYNNISPAVVRLRTLQNNWIINTPKGKKGQKNLHTLRKNTTRTKKAEKFQNNPEILKSFEQQKLLTPTRFLPLLTLAMKGSRTASDKLNCLSCSNWQTQEVKHCQVTHCHKYPFRPYQNNNNEEQQQQQEEEQQQAA